MPVLKRLDYRDYEKLLNFVARDNYPLVEAYVKDVMKLWLECGGDPGKIKLDPRTIKEF